MNVRDRRKRRLDLAGVGMMILALLVGCGWIVLVAHRHGHDCWLGL